MASDLAIHAQDLRDPEETAGRRRAMKMMLAFLLRVMLALLVAIVRDFYVSGSNDGT